MRWWTLLASVILVVYPLLVYWGMHWMEPRFLGLLLVAVYAVRIIMITQKRALRWLMLFAIVAVGALFWLFNSELLLRLVPAFINIALALGFAYTLYVPPTLPARMATLKHGFLTPALERYTSQITCLWVGFFCVNASIAAATALWTSREVWALYNGLIAYGLIGLVFASEYAYRRLVFAKKNNL